MHHSDYYIHYVRQRHEENLARAAVHRQRPRRRRRTPRLRRLAARGLLRLAERLSDDVVAVRAERAP